MIESMLGDSDIEEYVEKIKGSISDMFGSVSDSLTNEETASNLAQSFRNIQLILANIEGITAQLDQNMGVYDTELKQSLSNVEQFTAMLAGNNEQISGTITNLNRLTEDLANAELGAKVDDISSSASAAVQSAEATMQKADETLAELKLLITNINEGEGTLGKLMTDEELFNNLNSTARNLDLLLQDFRLNPKRYVNVSVFGKKQKDYAVPEDDPAMQQDSTGNN
jgi:phospholipid/cholesterol/gamma-HCH transport system substrate-binding protein